MAGGYIGKISAIVTANTSDLSRKLSQSSKEANAFAASLTSSIDRAGTNAQKSLEKIFTPLQQLERQLKAASFRSLKLKLPVDKVRAFVSAAEGINKPLERASSSFSKLSTEVQAAFKPALDAAQAAALRLNQQIAETGTASAASFQIAASEARKAEQAIQRLAQAQQIAAKGLTGRELQFSNPAAFASLNRTAELTQQAGRLPAGALEGSDIANRVAKLNGLSQSISVGLSKLESLRIDPTVNTTQIEQAEKKLQNLVNAARKGQDELEDLVNKLDPLSQKKAVDAETKALIDREKRRKRDEETDFDNRVKDLGFSDGNAKGFIGPKLPADVEKARQATKALREEVSKLSEEFGQAGNTTFFESSAIRKQERELLRIRSVIGNISSAARGPAVKAFDAYSRAVSEAAQDGEAGLVRQQKQLEKLRQSVLKLAAATGEVGTLDQLNSGGSDAFGDVSRRGVDKYSLALNQAAFAVDDFFSATGGLEFKLRAVQNNLTQLAFILGGTQGLFIGLGIAVAAQAAIALSKFVFESEKAKESLKALNESLASQESSVKALADAYRSLSTEIANASSSQAATEQNNRRQKITEIRDAAEQVQREQVFNLSPDAVRLRAELGLEQNKLNEEVDIGERQRILSRITQLESALERALDRGIDAPSGEDVFGTVTGAAEGMVRLAQIRLNRARLRERFGGEAPPGEDVETLQRLLERRQQELETARSGGETEDQTRQLRQLRAALARAEEDREAIEALRARGERFRTDEDESRGFAVGQVIAAVSEQIARIAASVERQAAIESVVGGAFEVSDILASAQEEVRDSGASAIQAELDSIAEVLAGVTEAAANSTTAEEAAAFEQDIEALKELAQAQRAAAGAAAIFSDTLKRLADELDQTVAQEARGRADSLRRQVNADPNDPFLQLQRREAESEARRAERQARENQEETIALRQQFEDDAIEGRLGPEIQALVSEREKLQADIESGRLSVEEERAARRRRREIDAELNERFEDSPQGRRAAAAADEADREAASFAQNQESERRGRDLMVTDGERAARATIQSIQDIENAAVERILAGEDIKTVGNEEAAARTRVLEDARRSAAPAIFALQDAVANAVLQGPSRAALNAADVTTTQGTAELNRLLRGDDPAKDQNLLELQKQTAELEKLNQTLGAAGVAP